MKTLERTNGGGIPEVDEEVEFHLRDYFELLWQRRWLLLLIVAGGLTLAASISLLMTPVYKSEATLQVQQQQGGGGFADFSLLADSMLPVGQILKDKTDVELLTSRTVAEQIVHALKLQFEPETASYGLSLLRRVWPETFQSLEASLEPLDIEHIEETLDYRIAFLDADRFVVNDEHDARIGEGMVNQTFTGPGFVFQVTRRAWPGAEVGFTVSRLRDATESLQERIHVSKIKDTEIIKILVEGRYPLRVRQIPNTAIEKYTALILSRRHAAVSQVLSFLTREIGPVQDALARAGTGLKDFKEDSSFVSLTANAEAILAQIIEAERELKKVEIQQREAALAIRAVKRLDLNVVGSRVGLLGLLDDENESRVLTELVSNLARLTSKRSVLDTQVTDRHPMIAQLDGQIRTATRQITEKILAVVESLRVREELLQGNIAEYQQRLATFPSSEQDLVRLTTQVEVNQNLYDFLLNKQKEMELTSVSQVANVWPVDLAMIPEKPSTPNLLSIMLLTGVLTLLLGIGLVFFLESWDTTVRTGEELTAALHVPYLGGIAQDTASSTDGQVEGLPVAANSLSTLSESFRYVRTNMLFSSFDREMNVVLVTSPGPGEGKTYCLSNLAVSFAQMGKRVLVIDADLRKPRLVKVFGMSSAVGLTNVLLGSVEVQDVVVATDIPNVSLIPSGGRTRNPAELLASPRMDGLLRSVGETYDLVLVDSPPLLVVPDGVILMQSVDAIALIVRSRQTHYHGVRRALEHLGDFRSKLLGVVVNAIDRQRDRYYYDQHDGYYGDTEQESDQLQEQADEAMQAKVQV